MRRFRMEPGDFMPGKNACQAHLQHIITAAALNIIRLGEWLAGTPQAKTLLPLGCPEGSVGFRPVSVLVWASWGQG